MTTLKDRLRERTIASFEAVKIKEESGVGTTNWRPMLARQCVAIVVHDVTNFLAENGHEKAAAYLLNEYNKAEP